MNKTVLVTGSSKGIGASIIKKFASNNYDVVITYNNDLESALKVQEEVNKLNVKSLVIKCDISNELEVKNMIDEIINKYGHIDVLINNASIEESSSIEEKNIDSFNRILSVNLIGSFLVTKEVSKYMLKEKDGSIINISSNNSINAGDINTLEYDVSKGGINVLTKDFSKFLAPYITVNAVAPGWIKSEKVVDLNNSLDNKLEIEESKKILMGRFGECEEVADLVYSIANNKYITGEIIKIDGGYID